MSIPPRKYNYYGFHTNNIQSCYKLFGQTLKGNSELQRWRIESLQEHYGTIRQWESLEDYDGAISELDIDLLPLEDLADYQKRNFN